MKKKLPKDVQLFREIRKEGYYYVDKTSYIAQLMEEGSKRFFLSRPRRFGKSLFVDTLKEAFEGNEELFEGLALHDKWDWSTRHPVICLDFSAGKFFDPGGLDRLANDLIKQHEEAVGLVSGETDPVIRLRQLIRGLYAKTGKSIVLLVDEYDKPILDVIEDSDLAIANRNLLSSIFGVNKQLAGMIRFCFFTGVSRFSKTNLFSGVNNLEDITIAPEYSAICGYTESDIDHVFAQELGGLNRDDIREWYNGYSWLGEDKVYNPWDILHLLRWRDYEPWWFRSGSPKYMVDVLKQRKVMSVKLDRPHARSGLLESFDVDNIDPVALLFQSGYLTITEKYTKDMSVRYVLDYPNREVRENINRLLLDMHLPNSSEALLDDTEEIRGCLQNCDAAGMESLFQGVLARLPRQWHAPVDITQYEAYIASVFYSYFMGASISAHAEVATSKGRIDLVANLPSNTYLFEFKVINDGNQAGAIKQIIEKDYAQQFRGAGKDVYLVGVEYSKERREIVDFKVIKDKGSKSETLKSMLDNNSSFANGIGKA